MLPCLAVASSRRSRAAALGAIWLAALSGIVALAGCSSGGGGGNGGGGNPGVAPAIAADPANATVAVGATATFTVTATGTAPLSYQWRKAGVDIPGATAVSYTTPAAVLADNGAGFAVVVSNAFGLATSATATLTVTSVPRAWQAAQALRPADGTATTPATVVSASAGGSRHAAAWIDVDQTVFVSRVRAVRHTPTGGWEAPVTIAEAGATIDGFERPTMAMDGDGRIYVFWSARVVASNRRTILVAVCAAGSAWTAPTAIDDSGTDCTGPVAAADPAGVVTVAWLRGANTSTAQRMVALRLSGGTISGTAVDIAGSVNGAATVRIAVANGSAVVAWTASGTLGQYVAANVFQSGGWATEATAVTTQSATASDAVWGAAMNAAGAAAVSFHRSGGGTPRSVHIAQRPAQGAWSTELVQAEATPVGFPVVALAGDGTTTMAWIREATSNRQTFASQRPPAGAWSTPVVLFGTPDGTGLQLDADGSAYAVSAAAPFGIYEMQAASLPVGGAWSAVASIESMPSVASTTMPDAFSLAPDGTGVSVWIEYLSGSNRMPWANLRR